MNVCNGSNVVLWKDVMEKLDCLIDRFAAFFTRLTRSSGTTVEDCVPSLANGLLVQEICIRGCF